MQKSLKYAIFKTKWGYFGLAGTEYTLCQSCLPDSGPEKIKRELLKNSSLANRKPKIKPDKNLFKTLQEQIIAYFDGACTDLGVDIPLTLDGLSPFYKSVLTTCRGVEFGQTISYSTLAKKLGRPTAIRAVGNALAKNPLPLIIPCHRVVRSDGKIGGFSAQGGIRLKKRMLELEHQALQTQISPLPCSGSNSL